MTNDEERIWGVDPTSSTSSNPITNTAAFRSNGNLTYTRRTTSLTGLTHTIWTSTNLTAWTRDTDTRASRSRSQRDWTNLPHSPCKTT